VRTLYPDESFWEPEVAAGGLMLAGAAWTHAWASESAPKPPGKARICVIFTRRARTGGPRLEHRSQADGGHETRLAEAEKTLGNVELLIGQVNNASRPRLC